MSVTRAFGDPDLTPDDFSSFSRQQVDADTAAHALTQLQPIPTPRSTAPMDLASVLGASAVQTIQNAGQIVFHTVGDTGGVMKPEAQFAVADAMAQDVSQAIASTKSGAAFWYHLGDVVYYCGQEQYYFEQFYDPYRNYNAPIFAIPGNHDGAIFTGEAAKSLDAFVENFCAAAPSHNPGAQGVSRTTMDQPGVYFTLNAPFVKFIGLYSNVSEGGTEGVISNSKVGTAQLTFLKQQLAAAKAERAAGKGRALVIATHHPPFTSSPSHIPSPTMLAQIDAACVSAGIQPDLYLSGHAHQYERYKRTIGGKKIPFIVAGMGGYYNLTGLKPGNKTPIIKTPVSGTDASNNPLTLETWNNTTFGFLRLTASATAISGVFVSVDPSTGKTGVADSFTLDLTAGAVSNKPPASVRKPLTKTEKTSGSRAAKKIAPTKRHK